MGQYMRFFGNRKIIIITRDPIKRAFSAHNHMFKKTPARDSRTFRKVLKLTGERMKKKKSKERKYSTLLHDKNSELRFIPRLRHVSREISRRSTDDIPDQHRRHAGVSPILGSSSLAISLKMTKFRSD
jgi:hypothetical protein